MNIFLNIIQNWHNTNGEDISYDTQLFYLIELFQLLKDEGLQKKDLKEVSEKILSVLDRDFIDESLHMLYQRRLAEEISYAFRSVMKSVKEVKEEISNDIDIVKPIEDGDIYTNNTSEPDIDLRGVDLGDISYDEEFIKELGIK